MLAILLIPICFVLVWMTLAIRQEKVAHALSVALPGAAVVIGLVLTIMTEALGNLGFQTRGCVILGWGLATGVALLVWLREIRKRRFRFQPPPFPWISGMEWVLCLGGVAIVAGTLVLGLFSSPEFNADVACYHLPRIIQWEQNQDLGFFCTANILRLLSDPFADYCLLNAHLLSGTDRFGFLFQWVGFAGGALIVGNIVRLLGGSRFAVGVARVLSLTIPVAICRSVGQDNDMVATFWLLCMVWFAVRLLTGLAATWDMVGFSASFALALLTKQYALLYALPVCIVLALRLFTRSPRRILTLLAIGAGMTMLVNAPHAARKYQFLGNMRDVLWPAKLYPSTVSIIGVRPTFSTLSRFAALMIMLPNARYEKVNRSWLDAVHRWMGLDPQDPRTTEQPWGLSGTPTYGAANIVAVFGIAVCLLFGLWRRHPIRRTEFVLLACMGAMLLLLATFSKFHIDLGRYLIRFHVATLTRPIVCVKYIIPFVKGS